MGTREIEPSQKTRKNKTDIPPYQTTHVLPVGVQKDLENTEIGIGGAFGKVLNNKEFLTG